jgi:glycine C-acetyltransferase
VLNDFRERLKRETQALESQGLLKRERVIGSPQGAVVKLADGREMINLCANNYLGLADHPAVLQAAHEALERYGYGVASVRFICGTQSVHRELEERLSGYLGMEDTILYSSCFDANGGLFETILDEQDAVISDALNHASIIDGIRLCKARRLRYANNDMNELEQALKDSEGSRTRLIATDGVFSMDGSIARLKEICDLAERYSALVMVDDSHATGFIGARGRGSHELRGVMEKVDIMTGTLGKALGGASGGYVSARSEIVGWLRQRSRPYLFSNSIAPPVAAGTLKVLDLLESTPELRGRVHANARYFRAGMQDLGFDLLPGEHPIVPIMLGEAPVAVRLSERMQEEGVYVVAFSYPVVPHGKARIRTQLSAAHSTAQLDRVIQAFGRAGRDLGIIQKART